MFGAFSNGDPDMSNGFRPGFKPVLPQGRFWGTDLSYYLAFAPCMLTALGFLALSMWAASVSSRPGEIVLLGMTTFTIKLASIVLAFPFAILGSYALVRILSARTAVHDVAPQGLGDAST